MAIKVIKPRVSNQPVGIVQQDDFSAEAKIYEDMSKTAMAWGAYAYKQEAEKAQKEGKEYADNVPLTILDPEDGFIKKVDAPEGWGRIRTQAFEDAMRINYKNSIDNQLKTTFTQMQIDPSNADLTPKDFLELGTKRLKAIVDATAPEFKGFVHSQGTAYLGASHTNVMRKQAQESANKLRYQNIKTFGGKVAQIAELTNIDFPTSVAEFRALQEEIQSSVGTFGGITQAQADSFERDGRKALIFKLLSDEMQGLNKDQISYGIKENWLGVRRRDFSRLSEASRKFFEDKNNQDLFIAGEDYPEIMAYINQHISSEPSLGTPSKPAKYGTPKMRDDNQGKIEQLIAEGTSEEDLYMSPVMQQMLIATGEINQGLYQQYQEYIMNPSNFEQGWNLYQIYNNATTQIVGDTVANVGQSAFPKEYTQFVNSIKPYMDIALNSGGDLRTQYEQAVTWYNQGVEQKKDFLQTFADMGWFEEDDNVTENNLINKIEEKIVNPPSSWWWSDKLAGLNESEARKYAHETMLYLRNQFVQNNEMDIGDSIKKITNTLDSNYGHDKGMYNASGRPAFDTGNNIHQRTEFTLSRMLPAQLYENGETNFQNLVQDIANMYMPNSFVAEYGKNLFLLIDPRSQKDEARYFLMGKDEFGNNQAIITPEGYPLAISTKFFTQHFYDEGKFKEMHADAKKRYFEEENKDTWTKIVDWFADDEEVNAENIDLLSIESTSQQMAEFEKMTLSKPDYIHKVCMNTDSNSDMFQASQAMKRNNPINITFRTDNKFAGSLGKDPDSEFEQFDTPANAYKAGMIILRTYQRDVFKGNMNVRDLVERWAGKRDEGNWDGYIETISKAIGGDENTLIDTSDPEMMYEILEAMTIQEIGWSTYCSQGWKDWEEDIRSGIMSAQ